MANATKLISGGLQHAGQAGLSSAVALHLAAQHLTVTSRIRSTCNPNLSEKTCGTLARLEVFSEKVRMHVACSYSMQLRHASPCLRGLRRAGTCRYMHHAVKIRVEMQHRLGILGKTKHSVERTRSPRHLRPRCRNFLRILERLTYCREDVCRNATRTRYTKQN